MFEPKYVCLVVPRFAASFEHRCAGHEHDFGTRVYRWVTLSNPIENRVSGV